MCKLLIVDDSSVQRDLIEKTFKSFGFYDICTASNGIEALLAVVRVKPDIVTMDIIMPEMDGLTCIEEILKIKKETIIFVITALTDPCTSLDAIHKGAKSIFLKPYNCEKLEKAVSNWLEHA